MSSERVMDDGAHITGTVRSLPHSLTINSVERLPHSACFQSQQESRAGDDSFQRRENRNLQPVKYSSSMLSITLVVKSSSMAFSFSSLHTSPSSINTHWSPSHTLESPSQEHYAPATTELNGRY